MKFREQFNATYFYLALLHKFQQDQQGLVANTPTQQSNNHSHTQQVLLEL